jgi:hypothetical protein
VLASGAQVGKRGVQGGGAPARGFGGSAPEIFFFIFGPTYFWDHISPHDIRWFSAHGFLPMVFYFRLRN